MKGVFLRKKFNTWLFLLFICGLFFIGLYIFINIVDPEATNELLIFLIAGILICLVTIPSWLLNFGAFIYINEDSIKAKYNWFGRIDCRFSDVSFTVGRVNTLIIQLKNGKCHTIMGIKNSAELSSEIRRKMHFEITEQPEKLIEKMNNLKSAKKKGLIYVCIGVALMFINIFITVLLTGERELYEFTSTDWVIFTIMGAIEVATFIATFFFAQKTGKDNLPIEKLQYDIRRTIVETKPLLPGYMIKIFTDDDYTGRITVFGSPHQSAVYYSVQVIDSEYKLIRQYTSDTYDNQEELPDDFKTLTDITKTFLK